MVRALLLVLLRLAVVIIQMAGLLAFFLDYLEWGMFASVLAAVALVLLMPLVATILGFIGAIKVWLWPWWLALLVFLPGLALSIMALAGFGAAGLLTAFFLRRVRQRRGGSFTGGPFAGGPFAGGPFARGPFAGQPGAGQPGGQQSDSPAGDGRTIEGEVISSRVDGERDR